MSYEISGGRRGTRASGGSKKPSWRVVLTLECPSFYATEFPRLAVGSGCAVGWRGELGTVLTECGESCGSLM